MKHMHIYIPDSLYSSLRERAFHAKTSMSKIIVAKLNEGIPGVINTPSPDLVKKEPLINSATIVKESVEIGAPRAQVDSSIYT